MRLLLGEPIPSLDPLLLSLALLSIIKPSSFSVGVECGERLLPLIQLGVRLSDERFEVGGLVSFDVSAKRVRKTITEERMQWRSGGKGRGGEA